MWWVSTGNDSGQPVDDQWSRLPGAPAVGSRLCHRDDIPEPGTRCIRLDDFPILVVRLEGVFRAYVNACPHQYLPLNHRGETLLSSDTRLLRCTSHGAGFSVVDGEGLEGLAIGSRLDGIPVRLDEQGQLLIDSSVQGEAEER